MKTLPAFPVPLRWTSVKFFGLASDPTSSNVVGSDTQKQVRNCEVCELCITTTEGRMQRGGLGLKPPLSLIFYKNFITFARLLIVFAYFLLVNLST